MNTTASSYTLPAHVPPELVVDIDIYDIPGGDIDPQAAWRNFKGKGPLVFSPRNGGHWVATCGSDVFKFYRDPEHFSSSLTTVPDPGADRMLPIQADPPLHADYRRTVLAFFTPDAVAKLEGQIRELAAALIDGFRGKGECEFLSDFALQLPLTIFLRMVGLPLEDRLYLRHYVDAFSGDPDLETKRQAHVALHAYLDGWIDKRIAEPGDDAISAITRGKVDGRPYTKEEMLATCTLLLHAGLDTVTYMLSFIARHLAQHPEQCDYIRQNPDKMHEITQELLRRFAVPNLGRVVAKDWTYKGVYLKEGDRIVLPPSLFNLDEELIDNPDQVDFSRSNPRHITFGSGPHTCAGALLARKEIAVFLEEWLSRIPRFSLDPARPPKTRAMPNNTVDELWLIWDV